MEQPWKQWKPPRDAHDPTARRRRKKDGRLDSQTDVGDGPPRPQDERGEQQLTASGRRESFEARLLRRSQKRPATRFRGRLAQQFRNGGDEGAARAPEAGTGCGMAPAPPRLLSCRGFFPTLHRSRQNLLASGRSRFGGAPRHGPAPWCCLLTLTPARGKAKHRDCIPLLRSFCGALWSGAGVACGQFGLIRDRD
jgi:hypothetical protein